MLYYQKAQTPLGPVLLASDGQALTGLWFEGQRYFAAGLSENATECALPVFEETRAWLTAYFRGEKLPMPEISLSGTAFQERVWRRLREIPWGECVTYGELAAELHTSPRAVGGAVGRNPVSVLVPCHRVVGSDGSLTGYAGGTGRKAALLHIERGDR